MEDKTFTTIENDKETLFAANVFKISDIILIYHRCTQLAEKAGMDVTGQVKFSIGVTDFAFMLLQSGEQGRVLLQIVNRQDDDLLQCLIIPSSDAIDDKSHLLKIKCNYIKNYLEQKEYADTINILVEDDKFVIRVRKKISHSEKAIDFRELKEFIKNLPPFDTASTFATLRKQGELLIEYNRQLKESLDLIIQAQNKAARLEQKNHELDEYSYVVTHDLKAPVRSVNALVDFIIEDYAENLPEDVQKQLKMIKKSMTNMHEFIQKVLEYSKAGRDGAKKEDVDISTCIRETLDAVNPPNNIKIELRVENNLPSLKCEKIYLVQVFQNLIDNAVKFMDKENGWIKISCEPLDEKFLKFTVADNGPGINEKHAKRIFRLFHTANAKDHYGSTGLGLSIVKKIIEEKGGTINVESTPGEGAKFIFTWPVE